MKCFCEVVMKHYFKSSTCYLVNIWIDCVINIRFYISKYDIVFFSYIKYSSSKPLNPPSPIFELNTSSKGARPSKCNTCARSTFDKIHLFGPSIGLDFFTLVNYFFDLISSTYLVIGLVPNFSNLTQHRL